MNPPERAMTECRDCEGSGETADIVGPLGPLVTVVRWCDTCSGHGEVQADSYDPEGSAYDTVKEARGLA